MLGKAARMKDLKAYLAIRVGRFDRTGDLPVPLNVFLGNQRITIAFSASASTGIIGRVTAGHNHAHTPSCTLGIVLCQPVKGFGGGILQSCMH
jgi:hypothetical protein